jgi:hypothetical protein
VTSNHNQRPCVKCRTKTTRSASGLCLYCRPAPTVEIAGDVCRIGATFDLPTSKAIVLAHRILDSLTPQITKGPLGSFGGDHALEQ